MEAVFKKLDRFFRGQWHIGVLSPDKGRWFSEPRHLDYLRAKNAQGMHILIKPAACVEAFYLLADDLDRDLLRRHHQKDNQHFRPGRMVIETSPRNFQVWIRSSRPLAIREKQYWLLKLKSDPGATPRNRWGRCPGFFNRKEKHKTHSHRYPLARLIWVDWKRNASIPRVAMSKVPRKNPESQFSHPPRGGVWQIRRCDYDRGDESVTDFSFCLALARKGASAEEIKARLMEERTEWKNHLGPRRLDQYLNRTITKVLRIIEFEKSHFESK